MPKPKQKPNHTDKKVSYKPEIKALVARRANLAAKEVAEVQQINVRRKVRKLVIRGRTHDKIAQLMKMDVKDVMDVVRDITKSWLTEEALEAPALREVELQNLRALKELAMYEAFPHPLKDDLGSVVMVRNCDCVAPDDPMFNRPCIFEDHNRTAMSKPNEKWATIVMQISQRISAMGGFDAADKHREKLVDTMERQYKGIAPAVIDNL